MAFHPPPSRHPGEVSTLVRTFWPTIVCNSIRDLPIDAMFGSETRTPRSTSRLDNDSYLPGVLRSLQCIDSSFFKRTLTAILVWRVGDTSMCSCNPALACRCLASMQRRGPKINPARMEGSTHVLGARVSAWYFYQTRTSALARHNINALIGNFSPTWQA